MPVDRFGLVGTVFVQKFRVDKVVAEGGFGVVYAAHHLALDAPIALKVLKIPEQLNARAREAFLASFVQEARMMARIKHPNIVQVLDTGIANIHEGEAAPWMALEWLTGHTLAEEEAKRRGRGNSPADVFALMKPILEAVAYAHEEGVAHRDLKPGNIMLVRTRRGMVPKLLDFGIAKAMTEGESAGSGATQTQGSFQAFSPHYAASEQIGRARTGPWTDVHALALIVTELLIGGPPYTSRDMAELFREVLSDPRPTPAKFGIDVGAWEPVLQRAMAFKPDARFPNAGEFLAALEQALPNAGGNVMARAASGTIPPTNITPPVAWGASTPHVTSGASARTPTGTQIAAPTPVSGEISAPPPPRRRGIALAGAAVVVLGAVALGYRFTRPAPAVSEAPRAMVVSAPAVNPASTAVIPTTPLSAPAPLAAVDAGVPSSEPAVAIPVRVGTSARDAGSGATARRAHTAAPATADHSAASPRGHGRASNDDPMW